VGVVLLPEGQDFLIWGDELHGLGWAYYCCLHKLVGNNAEFVFFDMG
jgi:hypothetical protein